MKFLKIGKILGRVFFMLPSFIIYLNNLEWSLAELATAEVALIYSNYGDFRHRDDHDKRMEVWGWEMGKYENTQHRKGGNLIR